MHPRPAVVAICLALALQVAVGPAVGVVAPAAGVVGPAAPATGPVVAEEAASPPVTTTGTGTRNASPHGLPAGGPVPYRTADVIPTGPSDSTGQSGADTGSDGPDDAGSTGAARDRPGRIIEVLPNPVADGDRGEAVRLSLAVAGNWTLADGETVVDLATRTSGTVLVVASAGGDTPIADPADRVVRAPALSLSNAGEELVLRLDGRVVHRMGYENAPEGDRWLAGEAGGGARGGGQSGGGGWRPLGLEPRDVASAGPANATLFVLPDAPGVAPETLHGADERILLAGYTLTSARVGDALVAARERGVDVRVLLEAAPVGDLPEREARLLDRLVDAGIEVRVLGGPHDRFAYHHAKYAVVDDAALVLTENWKPAGVGGTSSRGWGVRVDSQRVADELAAVFAHDAGWKDAIPWQRYRRGRSFGFDEAASGEFPRRFEPREIRLREVRVLTTPGNARDAMVGLVENATSRVDVVQPTVGDDSRLLRACLRAARRGVEVRILVSGAWYVAEDNRRFVEWLNGWADRTGAPLEARLAEPRGRYEKVHAKGLLVDDRVAVVGSLNWNAQAATENREVLLALVDRDAVVYYRGVFEADWRADGDDPPLGLLAGVAVAAVGALYAGRRTVSFGGGPGGRVGGGGFG